MEQKTARDRLARGAVFPTPWGKTFFGAVQIMHILFSYFHNKTVNTLIEDIFLYNMMGSLLPRTHRILNALLP